MVGRPGSPTALGGIRILDLSRVLAGPYCTQLLADYGADVVKVERPATGDDTRHWGPPWVGDFSAYFLSANRNKRSLTLDLSTEKGRTVLRHLAASADILVENFKPGTMRRWGLDYETLAEDNPALIYCAITGYGQTGPYRDRPGYDFMIQAEGGIMSITGPAEGAPHKVGVAIVDVTAGLFATTAILAALRERGQSGQGQYIDVALLDAQIAWLINVAQNYFATGETPARYGNAHPNIVPYQPFETADGQIALAVGNDSQFERFCEAVGRADLAADKRFQHSAGRVAGRAELVATLSELFETRTTEAWLELLSEAGIPAAPINNIPTILADPHVRARQMVQTVAGPEGPMQLLGPVARLSRTPAKIQSAPPALGADSEEVLRELGYSDEQIEALRASGVI